MIIKKIFLFLIIIALFFTLIWFPPPPEVHLYSESPTHEKADYTDITPLHLRFMRFSVRSRQWWRSRLHIFKGSHRRGAVPCLIS